MNRRPQRAFIASFYRLQGMTYTQVAAALGRDDDPSKPVSATRAAALVESCQFQLRYANARINRAGRSQGFRSNFINC